MSPISIDNSPESGPEGLADARAAVQIIARESDAIATVASLLEMGVSFDASDIYFEPWDNGLAVRFRVDGVLHDIGTLPAAAHPRIVARLKVLAKLPVYEKNAPQDGRIERTDAPCERAFRISTFPTVHGESVVLRVLGHRESTRRLDELGFSSNVTDRLRRLIALPQGVVLLTGPSSSGKTTTIYALLRALLDSEDRARHIVTIEDPVEYRMGRIAQTQISPHGPMTFEGALRSILRQDPDVIVVGEIRDADTARTAVQAGLTGHLVISTIHSGSAAGVFGRLLDMGVDPYLIASSVAGVLAQRLVRLNCPDCRAPYEPDVTPLREFPPKPASTFLRGAGCESCRGIGFRGRTAIGELLLLDREFADAIQRGVAASALHDRAVKAGMNTLLDDALDRVASGETAIEELRYVLTPVETGR